MTRWFCKFNDVPSGPFTRDELEYLQDRGQLTAETEIRGEGEKAWSAAANQFRDLFPQAAVAVAEPPPVASAEVTAAPEPMLAPTKAAPPPLPQAESEAERRRKQMLMGGGLGVLTALIIFLLLWLLLLWGGGGGFGGGGLAGGGQGGGQGSGSGTGVGPGSGSGSGGGQGSGHGPGTGASSGPGASQASNSAANAGGNQSGGAGGQNSAGSSGAAGEGDGADNQTIEEASLDPAPPPRSAFQRFKPPAQNTRSGGSKESGDGGFLSGGGGGGSDGSEFLGVKVRGKIALVCDVSGSMAQDFPVLVRELREKFPKDTPLILVPGCRFDAPGGQSPQKLMGQMPYMPNNEFADDPHAYTCYSTTDAIIFAVEELKRNTVMFNNDLQDGGTETAVAAFEQLRKKKKFTLSGRSLNCDAPPRLQAFIKASGGDFKVDPLSRSKSPAVMWSP